jgi:tRNA pseudouridine55 synthase
VLGILLIDKPRGITSHDAVNDLRRRLGTKRVGHAGTLDPLATGLLVVAVGPATRFLQYLPLEPKEYEAEFTFGRSTDTFDAEGQTTSERPIPAGLEEALKAVMPRFKGLIEQVPPMHSAVKVGGKPLYKYARKGELVDRVTRTIHIQTLDLRSVEGPVARMRVVCSGGTYIRTLANDLGEAVGCGAFMSALRRTRVGRFFIQSAVTLDAAGIANLIPLREALPPMPLVQVDVEQARAIREGKALALGDSPASGLVGLVAPEGEVFSVARVHGNRAQPECVIPSEAYDAGS